MKLRRRRPRAQSETIVALIDVVFFLLVFFLLVGRMEASAPFSVTPPFAESGSELPGGGITILIGATGILAIDGQVLDEAAVLALLSERIDKEPGLRVRLNADGATALRHILPLAARLESTGVRDVVLIVGTEASE